MHIACVLDLNESLYPKVESLIECLEKKSKSFHDVIKIGRTHLQDAVPLRLGDEVGGWAAQIRSALKRVREAEQGLLELALGGTAVGSGINCPKSYPSDAASEISRLTGKNFRPADNFFEQLAGHDAIAFVSGSLRNLAGALLKVANDVRWLASGPRAGLGELIIPSNEPGSSIMPGKVNPTQSEALSMVVAQVYGNDTAVAFAASQGNFELNVYKPIMIHNTLESIRILADGSESFRKNCIEGLEANQSRIQELLDASLMLVTALNTHIGYEKAAEIAKKAYKENTTLKAAALALGYVSEEEYSSWVDPKKMVK